ncbi:MAG TPA: NAD(P)/FAD-dependent oxidoreductase [Candidatus Tetragenococcus pullicola]|nr:NAD(P)/FAD-dependent oxidoreductase [Candidatus Tetragenococcus pullicola]
MTAKIVDVVIIGGGPAGLYAAFYGGLREMSVTILEAQEQLGGKLSFYPEKFVWDIGALPPTKGKQIKDNLIAQAKTFEPTIFTDTKVNTIVKKNDLFYVIDEKQAVYPCRAVLFAIGGGIVTPIQLDIPIEKNAQSNIHYTFPEHSQIYGQKIIVTGGGNAALDYANECLSLGCEVSLVYRGKHLKALEKNVSRFIQNGGHLHLEHTIASVSKDQDQLKIAVKENNKIFYCDHLIVQYGHTRDSRLLKDLSFDFMKEDDFYLYCQQPTLTNVPGIFAAGDIHRSVGKLGLLAGAFQDGASSMNQIKSYLSPESPDFGVVSSHNHKFDDKNQKLATNL